VRIGFGSDHVGFECKEHLKVRSVGEGHTAEDFSAGHARQHDYRGVTEQLASAIYAGRVERGVLVCSSAIGASVLANKRRGVRAALCHDLYSAQHGVEDDDMNLLVMGACVVTQELACKLMDAFIQASHVAREQVFRRLATGLEDEGKEVAALRLPLYLKLDRSAALLSRARASATPS